ncbi:MAG: hypothetical protein DLM50_03925 [Candidatus Meridianibacter frigidus]|nr:MAG: hypothetical protein DLM50_03925 [Candidatus Eremiobacteraeota bacterium]
MSAAELMYFPVSGTAMLEMQSGPTIAASKEHTNSNCQRLHETMIARQASFHLLIFCLSTARYFSR